ncbi:hypothetical protein GH714_006165 [Hevea brasiliensis]|uniref:Uncharacterized protein n=1 Tax=Hevea brasiliensis TaxID=3981 RepID=A0A6A6LVL3_HEVBR|nr:hypothetical protein GH714_005976 [Hevea brasiliensis]KAF2305520.1 hypothetical protein GH714_006165 [Hevea brasiliensis]
MVSEPTLSPRDYGFETLEALDAYMNCEPREILKIQKFRRLVSYTGFYCFVAVLSYAYTNNTTRAGYSRADQFYASYPAGTELLTDTAKLYKAALGNCFESEERGPIEFCIMAKHFDRQGKSPYAYHAMVVFSENLKVLI